MVHVVPYHLGHQVVQGYQQVPQCLGYPVEPDNPALVFIETLVLTSRPGAPGTPGDPGRPTAPYGTRHTVNYILCNETYVQYNTRHDTL